MDDLISRQAAIEIIQSMYPGMPRVPWRVKEWQKQYEPYIRMEKEIKCLPSAQPTQLNTPNTLKALDCISRQDAVDIINGYAEQFNGYIGTPNDSEVYAYARGLLLSIERNISALLSAQPEPCEDAIDALNESIKHFDDLAEECRRNANIERNDYMDMRDDAAEYRQLSIWLNELKWLRERFQSQSEQKWIPVSKKLPKEDTPVLVTDDAGGMATVGIDSCGRYEDTGERFWYTSQNVTAWMYTVKPYRGEQE